MVISIIIVCEVLFIIIVGEIKYRYENKKRKLVNEARKKHILSSFFPSILIEKEMRKKL